MEAERHDILPSFWPACIGFALSQVAVATLMVVLAVSAHPNPRSIGMRGSLQTSELLLVDAKSHEENADTAIPDGCDDAEVIPKDVRCLVLPAEVLVPLIGLQGVTIAGRSTPVL